MATPHVHKAPPQLNKSHAGTYDAIFRHPITHNLSWDEVRSLFSALGEVVEGHNGSIKVTRSMHTVTFRGPRSKDPVSVEDMAQIRTFLERAEVDELAPLLAGGAHLLVVIDHSEARIYRTETHGAVPQRIVPYDPHGFGQHLHTAHESTDGKRPPERKSYYEAVAKTLRGAEKILIFGGGTGASSAMQQLLADLKRNHADIAGRVIGAVVVDEHHTTENQLLAKAREFYAALK